MLHLQRQGCRYFTRRMTNPRLIQLLWPRCNKSCFQLTLMRSCKSRSICSLGQKFASEVRNGVDPVVIPDTPKTYEKKESGGVMGLMTDFKTDLKTDMTEAEMEEKFAAKEYVRIMAEAQESRAGDVKSLNEKKSTKATLEEAHHSQSFA